MRLLVGALPLGFALLAVPVPEAAAREVFDDDPLEITADQIEYQREREIYLADGNVHVIQAGGRTLDADWVVFSAETRRGVASGGILWIDGDEELRAGFIEFDLDTLEGTMIDGYFDGGPGNFRFWAGELVRTGVDQYRIEDGRFTTCRCSDEKQRRPWEIEASSADVEIGGYATARNATVEVLGVPLLWFPWLIFPVKTERETGFLFPEFGYSNRRGGEIGLPFFWAVHDQVNVTVTPAYLTLRGFKPKALLEYVVGEDSSGKVYASFIHDTEVITQDPYSENRWAFEWENDWFLPTGTRLRGDVHLVSDNQYVNHFNDLREFRRERFMESKLFGFHHFLPDDSLGTTVSLVYADDLQSRDNVDRDEVLLQRLPDVSLSWLHTPWRFAPVISSALDVDYTYFWAQREVKGPLRVDDLFWDTGIDGIPDFQEGTLGELDDANGDNFELPVKSGPQGNHRYDEGEPLADRGNRLIFNPRVGMPMRLFDALEFYPEVGYQEALYATDAQDFAERGVFTARADLTARMRRSFDTGDGSRVTHRFAPQVGYVMARQRGQSGDPIFVPPSGFPQHRLRQLARENVVLDPADRVRDSNALSLGFLNRLYASARDSGERLAIEFSLSGMYDFENSDSTLIILDGRTFGWWSRLTTRFNLSYSPVENRIEEGLLDLSYRLPKWRFIGGNIGGRYRYLREIPPFFEDFRKTKERFANFDEQFGRIDQFTARMRIELGRKWAVGYVGTYDIEGSELITNRGYVEYQSRCECWAIQVEAEQDERNGLEFTIRFAVLGLGDDSRRPFSGRGGLGEVKF